jgi:hypothetical protein
LFEYFVAQNIKKLEQQREDTWEEKAATATPATWGEKDATATPTTPATWEYN